MSRQTLEAVIGRAILDEEFRLALFADPEAALAEYELTADEMVALKWADAESIDVCAVMLGERILQRLTMGQPIRDDEREARHDYRCANRNVQLGESGCGP